MADGSILPQGKPSGVETSKRTSRGLRGGIAADLAGPSPQVSKDTYNLLKFHGSYEQYDRDTATELKQAGQEKDWQFMARVRIPAGRLTAAQYLALDALSDRVANGTLRITTRQALQFHGILKWNLTEAIAAVDATLLTTFGACGDVVRNVMSTPAPVRDGLHARLEADARMLSEKLLPRSNAHREIFVDGEALDDAPAEPEPLYGATYLPRKFKIALAHAGDNTVDALANDLALIALDDSADGQGGYLLAAGGGLGMTHNKPRTYPRLATPLAWVPREGLLRAAEAVVALHRDLGDRSDRKRARLKYVLDDIGIEAARARLEALHGAPLAPPPLLPRFNVPDHLGWHAQGDGRFWLGVPVPSGRIANTGTVRLRTALREVVARFGLDPILTPTQDILLSNVLAGDRDAVDAALRGHGVVPDAKLAPVERWALACPALPTCGLALAEAERVRDPMVGAIHAALSRHGLGDEKLSVRITGCPNGCARPYTGDIGIVGRTPGTYALYVGGDFAGTRLSQPLTEKVPEAAVADVLEPLFAAFAAWRLGPDEGFGDFCHRIGHTALFALLPDAADGR